MSKFTLSTYFFFQRFAIYHLAFYFKNLEELQFGHNNPSDNPRIRSIFMKKSANSELDRLYWILLMFETQLIFIDWKFQVTHQF